MLEGEKRGRLHINGLAGLDVKVPTRTTTRDEAILECSEVMDDLKICLGEINEYYNMMPNVEIAAQMEIAFRGPNAVENYPNIDCSN